MLPIREFSTMLHGRPWRGDQQELNLCPLIFRGPMGTIQVTGVAERDCTYLRDIAEENGTPLLLPTDPKLLGDVSDVHPNPPALL